MNIEIKFRGKKIDDNKWVSGFYLLLSNKYHQILTGKFSRRFGRPTSQQVDPKTVGQFTGLKDKNGIEIYEGDIVRWTNSSHYWEAVIETVSNNKSNTLYAIETYHNVTKDEEKKIYTYERSDSRKGCRNDIEYLPGNTEVIGNIHDNPKLLNNE